MLEQQLMKKAENSYLLVRSLVGQMSQDVKASIADFDETSAYCQLDIIVQYVLLRTAVADGQFSVAEGQFIDKITANFDVLNLVEGVPAGLNWSWLAAHVPFEKLMSAVQEVEKLAEFHMRYFCETFAVLDAITVDDLLGLIIEGIGQIVTCFVLVDGHKDEVELQTAHAVVYKYVAKPWLATMKNVRCNKKF